MTMRTWAPTGLFIVKWVSPKKLISFRAPWLSLCRHLLLQTNWTLVLITVLCTPVWNSRSRAKTNAKKKRIWKPQCFGLYQTTLFAQLRGVPTSIQELERVVLGIAASVDEKGDVEEKCAEPWNEIEFQNLLYQRHCCDQTQRRQWIQLSKTIRKFLRARILQNRDHCMSKILKYFQNQGDMEAIRFEPLRPCKKSVTKKPLPTEFARFLSGIFHCAGEVRELRCRPRSHCMIQPFNIEERHL